MRRFQLLVVLSVFLAIYGHIGVSSAQGFCGVESTCSADCFGSCLVTYEGCEPALSPKIVSTGYTCYSSTTEMNGFEVYCECVCNNLEDGIQNKICPNDPDNFLGEDTCTVYNGNYICDQRDGWKNVGPAFYQCVGGSLCQYQRQERVDSSCLSIDETMFECKDYVVGNQDIQVSCASCQLGCDSAAGACRVQVCNNGVAEGTEECDGSDLRGRTCVSEGYPAGGTLRCRADCSLDHQQCSTASSTSICGNGIKEGVEQCDLGSGNGVCPSACSTSCRNNNCVSASCGDGVIQQGEQCDDGSRNGVCPSACSAQCTRNSCALCGNWQIDPGEDCDSGNLNGFLCTSLCYSGGTLSCVGCKFNTAACTGTPNCGTSSTSCTDNAIVDVSGRIFFSTGADLFMYDRAMGLVYTRFGSPEGYITSSAPYVDWDQDYLVFGANLNGDGLTDLIMYNNITGTLRHLRNDGQSSSPDAYKRNIFSTYQYPSQLIPGADAYPADFNGDGITDLLLYSPLSGEFAKIMHSGFGNVQVVAQGTSSNGLKWPAGLKALILNWNGDANLDVFLWSTSDGSWDLLEGTSTGFNPIKPALKGGASGAHIIAADFDGGGRSDMLVYYPSGNANDFISFGEGKPQAIVQIENNMKVYAASFNNDNYADLFIYDNSTGEYNKTINSGNSLNPFPLSNHYTGQIDPGYDIFMTDFNKDGMSDIFAIKPLTILPYGIHDTMSAVSTGPGTFDIRTGKWLDSNHYALTGYRANDAPRSHQYFVSSIFTVQNQKHYTYTEFGDGVDVAMNKPDDCKTLLSGSSCTFYLNVQNTGTSVWYKSSDAYLFASVPSSAQSLWRPLMQCDLGGVNTDCKLTHKVQPSSGKGFLITVKAPTLLSSLQNSIIDMRMSKLSSMPRYDSSWRVCS